MIIGVKYGLFGDDHVKLISELKLSMNLNFFDLVSLTVCDKLKDNLWLRLGFRYDDLQLSEDEHFFKLEAEQISEVTYRMESWERMSQYYSKDGKT